MSYDLLTMDEQVAPSWSKGEMYLCVNTPEIRMIALLGRSMGQKQTKNQTLLNK